MAQINLVQKRIRMGYQDIIKFQLMTYCFMKDIQFSNSEMDCLTLLATTNQAELAEFCNKAVESKVFKTSQTVRNFLTKAENMKFIIKEGTNKKKISLNPELQIQTVGNIVLDMRIVYATKE